MTTEILLEVRNHVGVLTLNRPAALNSLSLAMIRAMDAALRAWASDDSVYAVLVKGVGEKAFCAGGDIRSLYQSLTKGGTLHEQFFVEEYRLDYLTHRYPKPYIALLDGITLGGGMGISQGAHLRIAGDRTRLAMPEVGIGLFPDVGASHFLPRLRGCLGSYLGLTGLQIAAADALYAGLVDVYIAPQAMLGLEDALAGVPWADDPVADLERVIAQRVDRTRPVSELATLQQAIDLHFSSPDIHGVVASLRSEQRPEYVEWAAKTLALILSRSPLMLAVTARQLQYGRRMSLPDCLRMELGMVYQCFCETDFVEGIRALMIDKDNRPRWLPATLDKITEEMLEPFFAPRWTKEEHPLAALEHSAA